MNGQQLLQALRAKRGIRDDIQSRRSRAVERDELLTANRQLLNSRQKPGSVYGYGVAGWIAPIAPDHSHCLEVDSVEVDPGLEIDLPERIRIQARFPDQLARHPREARLWLPLYQIVNRNNKQHIAKSTVKQLFIDKQSSLRMFGRRQLDKILKAGDGTFWDILKDGRLFIYGGRKVREKLGVKPSSAIVEIDVSDILESVTAFKRACKRAFHERHGDAPIARQSITDDTGLSRTTQWRYEQRRDSKTRVQPNHKVIGRIADDADMQAVAWHVPGSFVMVDKHGRHGPEGDRWLVKQTGNRYHTKQRAQSARGRNRRLNQHIGNRADMGERGNDYQRFSRTFCNSAMEAEKNNGAYLTEVRAKSGASFYRNYSGLTLDGTV